LTFCRWEVTYELIYARAAHTCDDPGGSIVGGRKWGSADCPGMHGGQIGRRGVHTYKECDCGRGEAGNPVALRAVFRCRPLLPQRWAGLSGWDSARCCVHAIDGEACSSGGTNSFCAGANGQRCGGFVRRSAESSCARRGHEHGSSPDKRGWRIRWHSALDERAVFRPQDTAETPTPASRTLPHGEIHWTAQNRAATPARSAEKRICQGEEAYAT
jgi:hypothetical protein